MIITGIEVIRGNPEVSANPGPAVQALPGEKVELTYGQSLLVDVSCDYRGSAQKVTLYGAIGNRGLVQFDEKVAGEAEVDLLDSPEFTPCPASVKIPITADIDPGTDYDLYCKIKEYPGAGMPEVDDVIDIVGIPPTYELIEETIYPYAYIYEGPHDGGTFTFKTDPFTPASWITGRLAAACEGEVRKAGGRVLEMRVYVDKSPLLWSDWRIEVVTAPPRTTAGVAMPLGIAWWAVAILAALAIVLIIVLTWAAKEIAGLFKRKPGLDEVKVGWEKDTLIKTIQDSEEYWERPLTPVETLEEMSEEELRDHLDKIAEEEVPEEISPWLIVALVGGLGVLGVGAVAAYSMAKPAK